MTVTQVGAVGTLLSFYRRRTGDSQKEVAAKSAVSSAALASYESGQRIPPSEVMDRIGSALRLSRFALDQLHLLAKGPPSRPLAGDDWVTPEDIAYGTPIFLRDFERESRFQLKADITEMWVVTSRPLATSGVMRDVLLNRLRETRTKFVYFIDSDSGMSQFQSLWDSLTAPSALAQANMTEQLLRERLLCVLAPPALCLQHFAICNPGGEFSRSFGRIIVYSAARPIGFTFMDSDHLTRAYNLLNPALISCKSYPDKEIQTSSGGFKLIKPASRVAQETNEKT